MGKRNWIAAIVVVAVAGVGIVVVIENQRIRATAEKGDRLVADTNHLLACMDGTASSEQPVRAPTESELEMAKAAVLQRLREPESARFSKVDVVTKECVPVVCGMVNARNGFGGMTGNRPFAVAGNIAYLSDGGGDEVRAIRMFCEA